MKHVPISAKNQVEGRIKALEPGPSTCMVEVDLFDEQTGKSVYASIPVDQVDELNLKINDLVVVVFPASAVLIAKPSGLENQIAGQV
ncbi:TOBE domain-containing protein [Litorivicinus sp.]|nr:TOBE domain-containing protein [Litorivicinus sp.]MDC1088087.1 TOBE domain-containing protein [Litorivicinus sp.]